MSLIKMIWGAVLAVALLFTVNCSAQECDSETGICDQHEKCSQWKEEGGCSKQDFIPQLCPVSCKDEIGSAGTNTNCTDQHERCHIWAGLGECQNNRQEMETFCAKSCGCGTGIVPPQEADDECVDTDDRCEKWSSVGECEKNPTYMNTHCRRSCKKCPTTTEESSTPPESNNEAPEKPNDGSEALLDRTSEFGVRQVVDRFRTQTLQRIQQTIEYFENNKMAQQPHKIRRNCKNRHELCSFWAAQGECQKNAKYMTKDCAAACFSCQLQLTLEECTQPKKSIPSLLPGSINVIFQRIVNTAPGNCTETATPGDQVCSSELHPDMPSYSVQVHSRPSEEPLAEISAVYDKTLPPWMISLDDFLTQEECDAMIQLGSSRGYKATTQEENAPDTVACSDSCRKEDLPKRLHERISRLLAIPAQNSEDFEFLRFKQGQSQSIRHDFDPLQKDLACGPRIITMILFLSDEGGGIQFPKLNDLTIKPKKGRVVLWPNALDSNPLSKNARMEYRQILAASKDEDTQFVASAKIHLFDWLTPVQAGCLY